MHSRFFYRTMSIYHCLYRTLDDVKDACFNAEFHKEEHLPQCFLASNH